MPCDREELEKREHQILAPYAQFSDHTRGRKYPEPAPDWRTHYQRDRDRIIHSRAFRRLEYKTQVFLNGSGDHLRTRLTHTMEVAAIARNIARALALNEDLTEGIALAHDLGHPPVGHKGEAALNQLMAAHGGFEHNRQSLRVVEDLEQKYPGFPGLNLTWEVREGLIKHATTYDCPESPTGFEAKVASLEAQVTNLADEITYYSHDLDDGLESGILDESELSRAVQLWQEGAVAVRKEHGEMPDECRRYFIIRCLIDGQVRDVVHTTERRLQEARVHSADEVRQHREAIVDYSAERRQLNLQLREYLYKNLYFNPVVHEPNVGAVVILEQLFKYYLEHPQELGEQAQRRIDKDGRYRAVCDYLSGMTDRYVFREFQRIFGMEKVPSFAKNPLLASD